MRPFVRVKVPFGITKTHTALVVRVHDTPPANDIKVKDVISVLDAEPVLLPDQYRLWEWISQYYMCPLGDIMVAALPGGIKNEDSYHPRTETYVRLGDKVLPLCSALPLGTLPLKGGAGGGLLQPLVRSPKQLETFTTFLKLSRIDNGTEAKEVTREELVNASHANTSHVKALVDKGFLALYEKEVGRLNTGGDYHPERIKPLSEAQQQALLQLHPSGGELLAAKPHAEGMVKTLKTADVLLYKQLKEFSKEHRKKPTFAEETLWNYLKCDALGVRFRRQHVLDCFIADFACLSHRLTIEIDGGYHNDEEQAEYDRLRTLAIQKLGFRELRFSNEQLLGNIDGVITKIKEALVAPPALGSGALSTPPEGGSRRGASLLHGVTSSGKTEIYIHLIHEAIERGEQVMYLLPEIALTVQMTQRLQYVFGNRLGIYHSKYSDSERVEIWQKQLSDNPYDVILGARSAVFLPYKRLGLVIIDEEHETSFKQQEPAPRYHARSVAMMMAAWAGARVVLGTATPSVESYYNAMQGKYNLVELKTRYRDLQLPHINIIDTTDLRHRRIMTGLLSPQLADAVRKALSSGEQAIIFQNRRGFSPVVECRQCGWSPKCPHCDVSLTYHKTHDSLSCHYCGYTMKMPAACPDCGNTDLRDRGAGTEKVEDYFRLTFPEARIARMDLDTTRTRNAYERIIAEFSAGKTNLLIGTQMVTTGVDFDNVSVVGILSADTMLNQPDFRAYEHAFAMMTQVAGRAGRKGRRGQVFLQTNRPELPVVSHVVTGNYEAFFRSLLRERKAFRYPPFTRLIYVYLKHKDENIVNTAAIELSSRLRQSFGERVLGPDKPAVARIKTLYIRKIMLKLETSLSITSTRTSIRQNVDAMMRDSRYKSLLVYFDVDPV